jgi:hypothetical protein
LPASTLPLLLFSLIAGCAAPSPAEPAPAGIASANATNATAESTEVATADSPTEPEEATTTIAQAADNWSLLLDAYTTTDGGFRYAALHANEEHRALLADEVEQIGSASTDDMSRDERLAFLINAYNTLTVASVIELWPIESVMSEDGFFDARAHLVAGEQMTLNALENDHIRTMGEPRIHFAVNCASAGCPPLARTPYTSAALDSQLSTQTRAFVRATTQVDADAGTASLSQIFEWFAGDFESSGGVKSFVAGYLSPTSAEAIVDESTTLSFVPYDWALNDR